MNMKSLLLPVSACAASLLLASCRTAPEQCQHLALETRVGQQEESISGGSAAPSGPAQGSVRAPDRNAGAGVRHTAKLEPIKYCASSSPVPLVISVESRSGEYAAVARAVEGAIANAGYEVSGKNPLLIVSIGGELAKLDQFGNYRVYEARAEMSVYRGGIPSAAGNALVARNSISAKGERKLGDSEASASSIAKLSLEAARWTKDVCTREMDDIALVRIEIPYALFEAVFGPDRNDVNMAVDEMLRRLAEYKGVYSCSLIRGGPASSLVFEVAYRKRSFPNGVSYDVISSDFDAGDSGDPVGQFMPCVFKIR